MSGTVNPINDRAAARRSATSAPCLPQFRASSPSRGGSRTCRRHGRLNKQKPSLSNDDDARGQPRFLRVSNALQHVGPGRARCFFPRISYFRARLSPYLPSGALRRSARAQTLCCDTKWMYYIIFRGRARALIKTRVSIYGCGRARTTGARRSRGTCGRARAVTRRAPAVRSPSPFCASSFLIRL